MENTPNHNAIDEIDPGSPSEAVDVKAEKKEPVGPVLGSEEEIEETRVVLEARPPVNNTTLDHEDLVEKNEGLRNYEGMDPKIPLVALPAEETKKVMEIASYFTRDYLENTKEGATWAHLIRLGMRNSYDSLFEEIAMREGADWRQYLAHENNKLSMGKITIGNKNGEKLSGPRAIQHVRALINGGTPKQIMLPHTGMWVSMQSLGDTNLVDLFRQLTDEKIEAGRHTYGHAFSNYSAINAGIIADYVFDMVYDSTLKDEVGDLGDVVLVTDLPMLVHGAAAVIWPNGFNYTRAVLNNAGEKMTAKSGVVSINKLQKIDNSRFNPWQTAHKSKRYGKQTTLADLEKYQSEFIGGKGREVELNENVSLTLKVPTINQYVNSGQRWINGIALMVDKAFAQPPTDDARNDIINTHGKATNMRQFAHWIKSINVKDNDTVVQYDEEDAIDELLGDMSAQDELAEKYLTAIKKYIADVTVSIIAIPVEKGEQVKPEIMNDNFPHLIPIDVLYTFFILLGQRVEQIRRRK